MRSKSVNNQSVNNPTSRSDQRMDTETRCTQCQAYRYFDVNEQGSNTDPWLCEVCELARLREENKALKEVICKSMEAAAK